MLILYLLLIDYRLWLSTSFVWTLLSAARWVTPIAIDDLVIIVLLDTDYLILNLSSSLLVFIDYGERQTEVISFIS